jgi:hypothetical protein
VQIAVAKVEPPPFVPQAAVDHRERVSDAERPLAVREVTNDRDVVTNIDFTRREHPPWRWARQPPLCGSGYVGWYHLAREPAINSECIAELRLAGQQGPVKARSRLLRSEKQNDPRRRCATGAARPHEKLTAEYLAKSPLVRA